MAVVLEKGEEKEEELDKTDVKEVISVEDPKENTEVKEAWEEPVKEIYEYSSGYEVNIGIFYFFPPMLAYLSILVRDAEGGIFVYIDERLFGDNMLLTATLVRAILLEVCCRTFFLYLDILQLLNVLSMLGWPAPLIWPQE